MKTGIALLLGVIAIVGFWFLIIRILVPSYQAGMLVIDNPSKYKSLHTAVYDRSTKGVERLIAQGTDLEATDGAGGDGPASCGGD